MWPSQAALASFVVGDSLNKGDLTKGTGVVLSHAEISEAEREEAQKTQTLERHLQTTSEPKFPLSPICTSLQTYLAFMQCFRTI